MNWELPDVQAGFRRGRETRDQVTISVGWLKKQENAIKISISAWLTMLKPLTVWITTNWKIFKEMRIPNHRTCLLRNLYAGQEATIRPRHGTMDWFQTGKGVYVCQGYILSTCLFNFYTEYIMQNARLDEAQTGIKFSGRSIIISDIQITPSL